MGAEIKTFDDEVKGIIVIDTNLWLHHNLVQNGGPGWQDAYDFYEKLILNPNATPLICDVVVSEFIHKRLLSEIKIDCKKRFDNREIDEDVQKNLVSDFKQYYASFPATWKEFVNRIIEDDVEPVLSSALMRYISYDRINKPMFNYVASQMKNCDLSANDAYIAAISVVVGCPKVATCDRDFKRVDGLTVYLPRNLAS